jgi:hypothetical protein
MKSKQLSIFIVFIFLGTILSVNYHHHYRENRIFQDDSVIFDTIGDNSDFSTCDIYQIILNALCIFIIIIYKILFTPRFLTCKFFTRAPPESFS